MKLHPSLESFAKGGGGGLRVFKSGPGTCALVACELVRAGRDVVLVAASARESKMLHGLLELFGGGRDESARYRPVWERPWTVLPPNRPGRAGAEEWSERWAALYALRYGPKPSGVLLTVDNLLPRWPEPDLLASCQLTLSRGEDMSPDLLLDQAVTWGYRRTRFVSGPGEIAVRGDILDITAPGYSLPLRMEFFGDTLEEIRLFDPASQRSRAHLDEAVLLPALPGVMTGETLGRARAYWSKLRTMGEMTIREEDELSRLAEESDGRIWPGLFSSDACGLEAYLPPDAVYLLASAQDLRPRIEDSARSWKRFLEDVDEDGFRWPVGAVLRPEEGARRVWRDKPQIAFEELRMGRERDGVDLAEESWASFSDLFWKPDETRRPWAALMARLGKWAKARERTVLAFRTFRSRSKFLSMAENEQLPIRLEYADRDGLYALVAPVGGGMELPWAGVRVLGENMLGPERASISATRADAAFEGLARHDDLAEGDLLVHRDYGLARFGGLNHMKVGEAEGDYLLLYFDADDKLYLPVDRISLVQRFKGPEGTNPSLDKLGGARWAKATARVRKAVEKIARELVEMYAFRRVAKGYGYPPPDEMYHEFESTFGFEETPGQARAVDEVFRDMERESPMDRLVCGDVGFGKTEVALRAAFRSVQEGKQVALLCPTTVLAEQHYQTFTSRMEGFPVRIGMLSRFVDRKRQKSVLEGAASGEVDILIGTHRLLSKDVVLPNLGLLILDEEQRFGVKHKERLKHYRQNIDVLTLTATPIPRTLQLSLSGLRGLSVIETPPLDRKPVETALVEPDEELLRKVLARELERGGQVFWVHNRVQELARRTELVQKLAPEARIGMAHGQMRETELEKTIHQFWHGELDILVCTAIVESGLDFPNANTLIVDQAQMFGLGQLYQLRGRVGRSDRQAYAYFLVPDLDALAENARRRLKIILEMDYLGAGFKVAMEDLRLRGAGNILGESQSGQIAKVGLDLFLEMLDEEVRRVQGETVRPAREPELGFMFEAHVPDAYVPDARERLRVYKALSMADSDARLAELAAELRDRFGPPPEPVENFLALMSLKRQLAALHVVRAELSPVRSVLTWDETAEAVSPEQVLAYVAASPERARLIPPGKLEIRHPDGLTVTQGMGFVSQELDALAALATGRETTGDVSS